MLDYQRIVASFEQFLGSEDMKWLPSDMGVKPTNLAVFLADTVVSQDRLLTEVIAAAK
jgi:hypothetical protein